MSAISNRTSSGEAPAGFGYVSQAIQRALDVLDLLANAPDGLKLTELASALDLPKSTAARLLANLELRQYVEVDESKRYHVGLHVFSVGGRALGSSRVRACGRSFLEDLALKVGESTYLAILDQDQALYIDRIESPMPVRTLSPIGSHRPLHATAVGKVLLASMDDAAVEAILERQGLAPVTSKSVTDLDVLRQQLAAIARQGYAIDVGEWADGLTCLAAPIRDAASRVVAAIGVSGPSWRVTDDRVPEVASLLVDNAARLSGEMGYLSQEPHLP